jgi:adenosylcobinamide amidohydrolase
MTWECLRREPTFVIRRSGRFLVVDLEEPHDVVSTSVTNGGFTTHLRHLVNHQSCEGTGHRERHEVMVAGGLDRYHDTVCGEIGVDPAAAAVMGTAANMNYVAISTLTDCELAVTAVATAGVHGNATCAGEPAPWRESDGVFTKVAPYGGTINVLLLINQPLTAGALARAVVTLTEGKSAALQRLAVPSVRHVDLATGTGTDQYSLAAPTAGRSQPKPLSSASPHMKLGELIGGASRHAILEALRWQNGLEPSYTRGLFHALGRYGLTEATIFDELAPLVDPRSLELLKLNGKSAFFEPMVGIAAHALATICDRQRHGMVPDAVACEALTQHAALLAANLAAKPHCWAVFRERLRPAADCGIKQLVLGAIALGWTEKWSPV